MEAGGADPCLKDRWGASPLDEARRVGAGSVVKYLDTVVDPKFAKVSAPPSAALRGSRLSPCDAVAHCQSLSIIA